MLERHVYVLKVWRDVRGEIHATLKGDSSNQTQHFPNLMAVLEYLKTQFQSVHLELETQPEVAKEKES